jgi:hypothetical protein
MPSPRQMNQLFSKLLESDFPAKKGCYKVLRDNQSDLREFRLTTQYPAISEESLGGGIELRMTLREGG